MKKNNVITVITMIITMYTYIYYLMPNSSIWKASSLQTRSEVIGRGQYGKAHLVRAEIDDQYYIVGYLERG